MTFSKSIYKKVKETFTLIGVACIDASLYDLKKWDKLKPHVSYY